MDPTRLLWADDDSYDSLDPFGRRLERANFRLIRAVDYVGAIQVLSNESGIHSLLLDVILPHQQGAGSLAYDLGITLAERAASMGIPSIAFLTVVRKDDVLEKYKNLTTIYPHVHFNYFDKTQLLEPNYFNDLRRSLNSTNNK